MGVLLQATSDDVHAYMKKPLCKKALEFDLLEFRNGYLRNHEPRPGRRFRPNGLPNVSAGNVYGMAFLIALRVR